MKKLISILLLVLLVSQTSARSRQTEQTNNVYIAARTDGLEGAGTKTDPFDGSTSTKLDAVLRRISNGTSVHFGPGAFQTAGFQNDSDSLGFSVKPRCKYAGAGASVTRVTVVTATNAGHFACAFAPSRVQADVSGTEVRDMTIDMNGDALVAANSIDFVTYGVALPGSNNRIVRVHLIHIYGHEATGKEAFGLGTPPPNGAGGGNHGNLIESCVVDTFAAGYNHGQMICISGGIARDNWVIGQTTESSAYQAYGANITLESCFALNCKRFLYMDTGDAGPVLVKNCQAWGITGQFVYLTPSAGFTHHDVTLTNNTVDLAPGGTFLIARPGGKGAKLYNIYVRNNTTTQSSGPYPPLNLDHVRNFHSVGNRWLKTRTSRQSDHHNLKIAEEP